jgi:hypothetical protein
MALDLVWQILLSSYSENFLFIKSFKKLRLSFFLPFLSRPNPPLLQSNRMLYFLKG